jgi:DNA-directed RNA polymerase subunit beta'
MLFENIPVLPPIIRPLLPNETNNLILSDINIIYSDILFNNNYIQKLLKLKAPFSLITKAQCLLQESVDRLFNNSPLKNNITKSHKLSLKTLSNVLISKEGQFRQNLLGKRVDFSGRAIIVSGPSLKIYQCGLPIKLALELFKPFLLNKLSNLNIQKQACRNQKLLIQLLLPLLTNHVILLNRAPTLHRLGIQAFEPILINGNAIRLHPLVCESFNADFDGDQMAVHLPLTLKAQSEAKQLVLASNNIVTPTTSEPKFSPTQDIIMGYAYLSTTITSSNINNLYFNNYFDILMAYEHQHINLQSLIFINSALFNTKCFTNINKQFKNKKIMIKKYIKTTFGRILVNTIFLKTLIL